MRVNTFGDICVPPPHMAHVMGYEQHISYVSYASGGVLGSTLSRFRCEVVYEVNWFILSNATKHITRYY